MWLRVPRIKIKTKRGRHGEGGIAQAGALPVSPGQGKGGGFHHCYGFPTVSEGAANSVRWSTDTASALVNARLCCFTAIEATRKVYFMVFLMARNAPNEFGFKRGGK